MEGPGLDPEILEIPCFTKFTVLTFCLNVTFFVNSVEFNADGGNVRSWVTSLSGCVSNGHSR